MLIKKRSLIKLLIVIPIVWIVVLFMFSLNDAGTQPAGSSLQDKEKMRQLQAQNNKLIAEAAAKHEQERLRLLELKNEAAAKNDVEDNDHPEEERKKAEEQLKDRAGPIQVHAPVEKNPNAPGTNKIRRDGRGFCLFS